MKSRYYTNIVNCRLFDKSKNNLYDIAIKKGKISDVRLRTKSTLVSDAKNYDAQGNLALPAFIDCHCHLFALGEKYEEVDLRNCNSIKEMIKRIRAFVRLTSRSGGNERWIFGRGWDQERFEEKRLPTRHDLDFAVGASPALMTRICGHIAVANTSALKVFERHQILSKFDQNLVPRESSGKAIGIIKETALGSCWQDIPKQTIFQLEKQFLRAQNEALRFGLSSVHCILDHIDQLSAIQRLDKNGKIKIKLNVLLPIDSLNQIEKMVPAQRKKLLRGMRYLVIGFKIFTDGSLGAKTAALTKPYSDDPRNSGTLNYSDDKIVEFVKRIKKLRLIMATHAIGDRALEQTIRCYERAGVMKRDRFRIEHASIVRSDLLQSLSDVILSVQPMFSTSDFWINERIGTDRLTRLAYPFKTLSEFTLLAGGSDSPVESLDPLSGIRAASRNRTDETESLTVDEALKLYTKNAASLSPLTKNSGDIGKGRNCDIVVANSATLSDIETMRVNQLFIDGIAINRT